MCRDCVRTPKTSSVLLNLLLTTTAISISLTSHFHLQSDYSHLYSLTSLNFYILPSHLFLIFIFIPYPIPDLVFISPFLPSSPHSNSSCHLFLVIVLLLFLSFVPSHAPQKVCLDEQRRQCFRNTRTHSLTTGKLTQTSGKYKNIV